MKLISRYEMEIISTKSPMDANAAMDREIEEILNTFDYSTYKPEVFIDDDNQEITIPLPSFALYLVNESIRHQINHLIDLKPYTVVVFSSNAAFVFYPVPIE
ncbi:MAG: hypothetical protein IJI85_04690 [Clostridia bacterium]|nr:hypothetical protein [Clostridia bacterium]